MLLAWTLGAWPSRAASCVTAAPQAAVVQAKGAFRLLPCSCAPPLGRALARYSSARDRVPCSGAGARTRFCTVRACCGGGGARMVFAARTAGRPFVPRTAVLFLAAGAEAARRTEHALRGGHARGRVARRRGAGGRGGGTRERRSLSAADGRSACRRRRRRRLSLAWLWLVGGRCCCARARASCGGGALPREQPPPSGPPAFSAAPRAGGTQPGRGRQVPTNRARGHLRMLSCSLCRGGVPPVSYPRPSLPFSVLVVQFD